MCGIAGIVGPAATADRVHAMVDALHHRGPDGHGTWHRPGVALGHTRLSIVDLSDRAAQPFMSSDGRRVCTFNGEIYNHAILREGLVDARTTSDTELLVELPGASRAELVGTFRGMYAFAVVDNDSGRVVAARDPFGIKPLYVAEVDGSRVFASELRALVASGLVSPHLAPTTIVDFLRFGAMVQPRTAIDRVRRLRPGAVEDLATPAVAGMQQTTPGSRPGSALADVVRGSVETHLAGDVEVGLFLSGGVDATVIARCLRDLGRSARCITFRVPGITDESAAADEAAKAYGLEHVVVSVSENECLEAVTGYLDAMDAPAADGLNTFLVSQAAARSGLKVCLSGAGGDELFGGYAIARRLSHIERIGPAPVRLRTAIARGIERADGRRSRRLAEAVRLAGEPDALRSLAHRIFLDDDVRRLAPGAALDASYLDRDDRVGYLRDVLLADADVFGMAHGLEIRVPFVDRGVAAAVDHRPNGRPPTKADLVASFDDPLLERRRRAPKVGFTLPIGRWLRGPLLPLWSRLSHSPPACFGDAMSEAQVAATAHAWRSGIGSDDMEIWTLAVLYQWGDRFDRLADAKW